MRRTRTSIAAIALLSAFVTGSVTPAAEYYLSPGGKDANPGTREAPWETLKKANETLQPGDTAVLLPGEYVGAIVPARSGKPGAPITYRSAVPSQARLRQTGAWRNEKPVGGEAQFVIRLHDREHIVIKGFHIEGAASFRKADGTTNPAWLNPKDLDPDLAAKTNVGASWASVSNCRHVTIRKCEFRRDFGPFFCFVVENSSQVRVLDNVFNRENPHPKDMVVINKSARVLFEGNALRMAGHSTLTLRESNYVVVRANVFHNEYGRNYVSKQSARVLFEGNLTTRGRDSAGSAGSNSQTTHDESILRYNRFFDNLGTALVLDHRMRVGPATHMFREPFWVRSNRIYHNTFADNADYALGMLRHYVANNLVQNNIFAHNGFGDSALQVRFQVAEGTGNRYLANLIFGNRPGQKVIEFRKKFYTAAEADAQTRVYGGHWSEFLDTVDADPDFVDPINRDYRLKADSPAIDRGKPLALAMGEGKGRELPVTDGLPFYDGFGIEGEQGDTIAVGSGDNLAQIRRVELRYFQPAILHLDREVSWTNGMSVSLPWAGESPDIGAFERARKDPARVIALARPAVVATGQTARFMLDPLGKQPEAVSWNFHDGTVARRAETERAWPQPGFYPVTVRATFADGRRAIDALLVKVEPPPPPDGAPLLTADFEDDTWLSWGHLFKFYRKDETGFKLVARPGGKGQCARLFYAGEPYRNRRTAFVNPGEWEIERYPLIRFDYRIPQGVPVSVQLMTLLRTAASAYTLAGSSTNGAVAGKNLAAGTLVDDGQWHTATLDVRAVRKDNPDITHLRGFQFWTLWKEDHGQQFWFDDFAILPAAQP